MKKSIRSLTALVVISLLFTPLTFPELPIEEAKGYAQPTLDQADSLLNSHHDFFTENKGQWDPAILFVGDTSFGKVAFTKDAVYYQLLKVEEVVKEEGEEKDTLGDPSQYHIDPFERRRVSCTPRAG